MRNVHIERCVHSSPDAAPSFLYVCVLRSHIGAMGMGEQWEVIARHPDEAVRISNFAGIDDQATT
jgi:hypothetical protein